MPCKTNNTQQPFKTVLSADELGNALGGFFTAMQYATFTERTNWVKPGLDPWFSWFSQTGSFLPYVQKLEVSTNLVVSFHGDLHGDVHSLNKYIERLQKDGYLHKEDPFKIKNPNFYMIFLGDYTDRGWYGVEVIYTILRLKAENSDKVFMVRGNHEDKLLNVRYGFTNEVH